MTTPKPTPALPLEEQIGQVREAGDTVIHVLKTWPGPFAAVRSRKKTLEIRKADRDYREGDALWLEEYDPGTDSKSGEVEVRLITHVLQGGQFGIEPGFCAISMTDCPDRQIIALFPKGGSGEAEGLIKRLTAKAEDCRRLLEGRHDPDGWLAAMPAGTAREVEADAELFEQAARLLAAHPAPKDRGEGWREALTDELVAEVMLDTWSDICADTDCHPLDIEQLGRRRLTFKPKHWSRFIAGRLRSALAASPSPRDKALVEEGGLREALFNLFKDREAEWSKLSRDLRADDLLRGHRGGKALAYREAAEEVLRLSALSTKDMAVSEPDTACGVARNGARHETPNFSKETKQKAWDLIKPEGAGNG